MMLSLPLLGSGEPPSKDKLAKELEARCSETLQLILETVSKKKRLGLSSLAFWLHLPMLSHQERLKHSQRLTEHGAVMTFSAQLKFVDATIVVADFKPEVIASNIVKELLKTTQTLLPGDALGAQI